MCVDPSYEWLFYGLNNTGVCQFENQENNKLSKSGIDRFTHYFGFDNILAKFRKRRGIKKKKSLREHYKISEN